MYYFRTDRVDSSKLYSLLGAKQRLQQFSKLYCQNGHDYTGASQRRHHGYQLIISV